MLLPADIENIICRDLHEMKFKECMHTVLSTIKQYPSVHVCGKQCGGLIAGFMGCPACWKYINVDDYSEWKHRQVNSDGSVIFRGKQY